MTLEQIPAKSIAASMPEFPPWLVALQFVHYLDPVPECFLLQWPDPSMYLSFHGSYSLLIFSAFLTDFLYIPGIPPDFMSLSV